MILNRGETDGPSPFLRKYSVLENTGVIQPDGPEFRKVQKYPKSDLMASEGGLGSGEMAYAYHTWLGTTDSDY